MSDFQSCPTEQAATERPIMISLFRALRDNEPKGVAESWTELSRRLTVHHQRSLKDGWAFSPTVYKPGTTRGSGNVEHVTMLVLDVDSGVSPDHFRNKLEGKRYLIYSTHSHTAEHPKYRVVIPLREPVPAADWPAVWSRVSVWVEGKIDPATKDAARLYLLPSHPHGSTDVISEVKDGDVLDVAELPLLPPAPALTNRSNVIPLRPERQASPGQGPMRLVAGVEEDEERHSEESLQAMQRRCWFLRDTASPEQQALVPEPLWMAALSNYTRFRGGSLAAHEASCCHPDYNPDEVDARLVRHGESAGPITCAEIQRRGYGQCPSGGCALPSGRATKSPAGLGVWARALEGDSSLPPHRLLVDSFVAAQYRGLLTVSNGLFYAYRHGRYVQLDDQADVKRPLCDFLGSRATAGLVDSLSKLMATAYAVAGEQFQPNRRFSLSGERDA